MAKEALKTEQAEAGEEERARRAEEAPVRQRPAGGVWARRSQKSRQPPADQGTGSPPKDKGDPGVAVDVRPSDDSGGGGNEPRAGPAEPVAEEARGVAGHVLVIEEPGETSAIEGGRVEGDGCELRAGPAEPVAEEAREDADHVLVTEEPGENAAIEEVIVEGGGCELRAGPAEPVAEETSEDADHVLVTEEPGENASIEDVIVEGTPADGAHEAAVSEAADPRSELIRRAFHVCDADGDGKLGQDEMQRLATVAGFDGADADWASEYADLCVECGVDPATGIDLASVERLVNDESESGCYCTDEELLAFLGERMPARVRTLLKVM